MGLTLCIICIQIVLWWAALLLATTIFCNRRLGEEKTKRILVIVSLFLLTVTILIAVLFFARFIEPEIIDYDIVDMARLRRGTGVLGFWLISPRWGIDGQLFRIIQALLISFLFMLAYLMVFYKKGETTFYILQIVFMIVAPGIGPLFLILSWIIQKIFFKKEVNLQELSFRKDMMRAILRPDEERERNVVPVKEALLVSDVQDKRRVMLDVLKGEYEKSLTVITDALENPDTEISHYAATVITEVKSNFKLTVQTMQEKLKDYPDDPSVCVMFILYIHEFLGKKVLSQIEAITYVDIYLKLMEDLFEQDRTSITGTMYRDMIGHLMESQNKDQAERWAGYALEYGSNDLASYKGVLKFYYEIGNKEVFFHVLEKLKASDIVLDKETLEIVRLFK